MTMGGLLNDPVYMFFIWPNTRFVGPQIITSEMHNIAENGSAAHSIYKDNIQNKEK